MKYLAIIIVGISLSLAGAAFSGEGVSLASLFGESQSTSSFVNSTHFDGARFERLHSASTAFRQTRRGRFCANLLVDCYHAGVKSIDRCVESVPQCEDSVTGVEMSQCCSAEGVGLYESRRKQGQSSVTAFSSVYN